MQRTIASGKSSTFLLATGARGGSFTSSVRRSRMDEVTEGLVIALITLQGSKAAILVQPSFYLLCILDKMTDPLP